MMDINTMTLLTNGNQPIIVSIIIITISLFLIGFNLFLAIKQSKATDKITELNQTAKEIKELLMEKKL